MKIEKGIAAPLVARPGRPPKYPFAQMDVGDSIFFADQPKGSQSNPAMVSKQHGAAHGKRFSARTENDGVRIWRIA